MNDQYRPLLIPDLDDKAIGSALDAERKHYRESLALQRGGRGTGKWTKGWKCCDQVIDKDVLKCPRCSRKCPGVALTAWKCCNQLIEQDVPICPCCSQARPNTVLHISIETEGKENPDARIGPFKTVLFSESLSNIVKHVPPLCVQPLSASPRAQRMRKLPAPKAFRQGPFVVGVTS